jgi:hypothetical protein
MTMDATRRRTYDACARVLPPSDVWICAMYVYTTGVR